MRLKLLDYMAEPPGIFIGRGEHPHVVVETKVTSKDVTLNLSKEAKVPKEEIEADIPTKIQCGWLAGLII